MYLLNCVFYIQYIVQENLEDVIITDGILRAAYFFGFDHKLVSLLTSKGQASP